MCVCDLQIESLDAIPNIGEIVEAADGVMVARGDLGAQVPFENVPSIQVGGCWRVLAGAGCWVLAAVWRRFGGGGSSCCMVWQQVRALVAGGACRRRAPVLQVLLVRGYACERQYAFNQGHFE